jgi:hypothetical protein
MKLKEMTPEQRREYNREQKAKSRAAKKEAERNAQVPTADQAAESFRAEYPERVKELDSYVQEFASKVSEELGRPLETIAEYFVIDRVPRCLLGLKRGWVQRVQIGAVVGELVGGMYFADACGDMVEDANRFGLRKSPTFDSAYIELLELVVKRYGKIIPVSFDIQAARAELDGKYKLPEPPESPKPELIIIPDTPVPSDATTLEQGRIRLLNQLEVQTLPPDARRYLDGTL